ncbi:MAG: flagellar basal-body rod protein FlgG [Isosphaera sp.]|nr:flagellar basal-body rod protein FlgG [Isosphaera sp.]
MLYPALFTSNTGLRAASAFLEVVGNNVANTATTGFKAARVEFQDLFYTRQVGVTGEVGASTPVDNQSGFGVRVDAVTGIFTPGPTIPTGRQFDLAVDGDGFFQVTLGDGTVAYTRAGNFIVDSNGQLATPDGFLVSPALTIPSGAIRVSVSPGGLVTADTDAGTVTVGQLSLTRFINPAGLQRLGDTLFGTTGAEGAPTTGNPGENGLGRVTQGFLEDSNVDLPTELTNLIVAQRTFQFNARAIQIENQTLAVTAQLTPDTNAGQ